MIDAQITEVKYLGLFDTSEDAAHAYDKAFLIGSNRRSTLTFQKIYDIKRELVNNLSEFYIIPILKKSCWFTNRDKLSKCLVRIFCNYKEKAAEFDGSTARIGYPFTVCQ